MMPLWPLVCAIVSLKTRLLLPPTLPDRASPARDDEILRSLMLPRAPKLSQFPCASSLMVVFSCSSWWCFSFVGLELIVWRFKSNQLGRHLLIFTPIYGLHPVFQRGDALHFL